MKNLRNIWILSLVLVGISASGAELGAFKSDLKKTKEFWTAFRAVADSGLGIEVLGRPAATNSITAKRAVEIATDIGRTERRRSQAIVAMSVVRVDPAAVAFAADYAALKADIAGLVDEGLLLWRREQAATSGAKFGLGILLNLIAHSDKDEGEALLWALLDQTVETVGDLNELSAPTADVELRFTRILGEFARLQAEHMAVRARLLDRHGVEFEPVSSLMRPRRKQQMAKLSDDAIAKTLIGQKVGGAFAGWTFKSLDELVELKVLEVKQLSDAEQDYTVAIHVKRGGFFAEERALRARLRYGSHYTRINLIRATLEAISPAIRSHVAGACVANLKQIDGAKRQWAIDEKASGSDVPTKADLYGRELYLIREPQCPLGGIYTIGRVDAPPVCSHGGVFKGHKL